MARNANKTVSAQPSNEDIAATLASIDIAQETAVIAGPIDHHTELSSWAPKDSDVVLEQVLSGFEMPLESSEKPAEYASREFGYEPSPDTSTALSELPSASFEVSAELSQASEVEASGPQALDQATEPQATTLEAMIANLDPVAVDTKVYWIGAALEDRETFETEKSEKTGLTNIHRTLKKVRSQMVTHRVARVMSACAISTDFINREVHTGSKYNVYALGKLSDIMFGVSGGAISNAINMSIIKALFICKGAGVEFTGEVAKGCASKQYRIEPSVSRLLQDVRYTVSTSTAPTQASSTMQALVTLGVVMTKGSVKNPTYTLTDHPLTRKLQELLAA